MIPPNTPQLRLPMQARPIHRTGSGRGAIGSGGVEADNIIDDIGSFFGGIGDWVSENPWVLSAALLLI